MSPTLAAITAGIIVTLCYVAACAYAPFGKHWRCNGTGRLGRKHRRPCPACDSTGHRVRLGRRIHTWLKHEHHNGQK